ncbi:MAG: ROK family protein [Candidatus Limnocylindrales bacterium]
MARTEFPPKATHAQTRAHNASLVLRALYDLGPISRAEIARLTGLTRTSAGELVAELESEGLAEDIGRGPSTGGKAPTLVALIDDARHVVTLDLGERTFSAALINLRGTIRRRATRDLEGADGDAALALVTDLIDEILAGDHQPILGIGVGTPGIVGEDGTIRWAVNLSWTDLPLGEILQARYRLPTIVANDSRAAAIATYLFGGEDRPSNLVAIKVGRGIGAGLVLNGELFVGDGDGAGEIGHIVVEPDGAECHCGRFGCLETVASAPAILRAAEAAGVVVAPTGAGAGGGARGELSLNELAAAAKAGDETALGVVRAAGRALGTAIANLIGILDVREIVVHGSVTALGEPWLSAIRDEATRRSLGPLSRETRLIDGGPGDDLTLLGAAAMLLTRELGLTVHR